MGVGPMGWARASANLTAKLENRLGQEAGGPVGLLLPIPQDGEDENLTGLRRQLGEAKGGTVLVETTADAWGGGRAAAPQSDWRPQRFGADPPATLEALRTSAGQTVAAACGIPPAIVSRSDGTALREAWRQFLFATIAPVSKLVELELSAKLDVAVTLTHEEMRASDLAARARAFQSMVGGGMDPAKAAGLAGLMAD